MIRSCLAFVSLNHTDIYQRNLFNHHRVAVSKSILCHFREQRVPICVRDVCLKFNAVVVSSATHAQEWCGCAPGPFTRPWAALSPTDLFMHGKARWSSRRADLWSSWKCCERGSHRPTGSGPQPAASWCSCYTAASRVLIPRLASYSSCEGTKK